MVVFAAERDIVGLQPDMGVIADLPVRGVIATARGEQVDFVSRFFAPQSGIAEDPATGSAHTTLTSYWSSILHKKELEAIQISARRGYLHCKDAGARIEISGKAKTYLSGKIWVS
jgi:predicted PhzF superfamily epimerase YddE/YHI9